MRRSLVRSAIVLFATLLSLPAAAHAVASTGFVYLNEVDLGDGNYYFEMTNANTSEEVVGFAVANDFVDQISGTTELFGGWAGGVLTSASWNAAAADGGPLELAVGTDVPGFVQTFGTGYSKAVVFWAHDLLAPTEQTLIEALPWDLLWLRAAEYPSYPASAAIPPSTVVPGTEGWYFHTNLAASPFAALTHDLDTGAFHLYTGETGPLPPIPEPNVGVLLLAGLAMMGWRGRRTSRVG